MVGVLLLEGWRAQHCSSLVATAQELLLYVVIRHCTALCRVFLKFA